MLGSFGNTPKTLHTGIRDALWERIQSGRYPPGSQIPSEAALCEEFEVSRITVRHALSDLERSGHIFKINGKGTFVSRSRSLQDFAPVVGFGEAMGRAGYEVVSKLLSLEQISAPSGIAPRLGLAVGDPIFELRRVRYLDRHPVRLDVLYMPVAIGKRLMGVDLSRRDIFSFFENELGIEMGDSDLEVKAAPADADTAKLLALSRGAPVLRIEWMAYKHDGSPLDFAQIYCRGDAFRYRLRVPAGPSATR
jgi:GntR family transcriptional regulator